MAHDDHDHGDAPLSDVVLRVRTLESLLAEKGVIDPKSVDTLVETFETKVGPHLGAKIVARARLGSLTTPIPSGLVPCLMLYP